jgi:DtxR family Mn-dependent transcriptional regulator
MITAVQQDYLEIIYRLTEANDDDIKKTSVRITDIASSLGTKLPTVTRTVKKLTESGYLNHIQHGDVSLTTVGKKLAKEIVHLHGDLFQFFTEILGVNEKTASADTCQIEHCLSPETAERLHEFLEYFNNLTAKQKKLFIEFQSSTKEQTKQFKHLPGGKVVGWRT